MPTTPAGLLITGTGDVFAPGGDLGGGGADNWMQWGSALSMDVTPFDTLRKSARPVVSAVNGLQDSVATSWAINSW
jgi:enoyl-CoA hydratase/carnithine racemase